MEQFNLLAASKASAQGSALVDGTLARPSVSRISIDAGVTSELASSSACASGVRRRWEEFERSSEPQPRPGTV